MGNIDQLLKKYPKSPSGYRDVNPNTFTDAVKDRKTRETLEALISRNNFIYLPYIGSKESTRLQLDVKFRRKGLWIGYITYDKKIVVEYYNNDNIEDSYWKDDLYWLPYSEALNISLNEEDLTYTNRGIEFANRDTTQGMGRIIVRRNKPILEQFNQANTIYEICYDFDLGGETLEVPANCILDFKGGSFDNGVIYGNRTLIKSEPVKILSTNISLTGIWDNKKAVPEWFGAVGDGKTDDTVSIQNCIDWLVINGGCCKFSPKTYIVSSTINIGKNIISDYSQPLRFVSWDRLTRITDNVEYNKTLKRIDIEGYSNTIIKANFSSDIPTPVLAYNLENDTVEEYTGKICNLIIESDSMLNNLIGLYNGRGSKIIDKIIFKNINYGLLLSGSYWTKASNIDFIRCTNGLIASGVNASTIANLNAVSCDIAYSYSAQNGRLVSFNTENCNMDLYIKNADNCIFESAYLEDTRETESSGYQIKVDTSYHCTFINILLLYYPNKGKRGYLFNSTFSAIMISCRNYGQIVDISEDSYIYYMNNDNITYNGSAGNLIKDSGSYIIKDIQALDSDGHVIGFGKAYIRQQLSWNEIALTVTINRNSSSGVTNSPIIIAGLPVCSEITLFNVDYTKGVWLTKRYDDSSNQVVNISNFGLRAKMSVGAGYITLHRLTEATTEYPLKAFEIDNSNVVIAISGKYK